MLKNPTNELTIYSFIRSCIASLQVYIYEFLLQITEKIEEEGTKFIKSQYGTDQAESVTYGFNYVQIKVASRLYCMIFR